LIVRQINIGDKATCFPGAQKEMRGVAARMETGCKGAESEPAKNECSNSTPRNFLLSEPDTEVRRNVRCIILTPESLREGLECGRTSFRAMLFAHEKILQSPLSFSRNVA
jgi:hypothetical protein